VRMLYPQFNLVDALLSRSEDVLQASTMSDAGGSTRLRYEAVLAGTEWRRFAAAGVRHLRRRGFRLQVEHEGMQEFGGTHLKAASRVSVALVTLGLYLASSLLMQHSLGPVFAGYPVLAMAGYGAAIWCTVRLFRAVGRGL
jgi:ubiquinone biosynthesis protein